MVLVSLHREQPLPFWWPQHPTQGSSPHRGSCLLWSPSLLQSAASHHHELIPLHRITSSQHHSWWKGPEWVLWSNHPALGSSYNTWYGTASRPFLTMSGLGSLRAGFLREKLLRLCSDGRRRPLVSQGAARLTRHHLHTFPVSQVSTAGTPAAMGRHFSSKKRHGRL